MVSTKGQSASVQIIAALDPQCPTIDADPVRLRQVLLNVLANAIKFTRAGGRIEVSTAVAAAELRIAIKDNGIGMAPDDIPRALEPFTQVGRERTSTQEGTGLGLPISKTLIELHGGRFEITSAPDRGTTVTITLPIHRADQDASAKAVLDMAV
ncbi:MAG TPA: ATP-binding protein [Candidatus Binataceae bacterium]|nr:ATP-binding protein [Candidatus Binataceae bacterium]